MKSRLALLCLFVWPNIAIGGFGAFDPEPNSTVSHRLDPVISNGLDLVAFSWSAEDALFLCLAPTFGPKPARPVGKYAPVLSVADKNHDDILRDLQNKAGQLEKQGKLQEAEIFYRKSVAYSEEVFGTFHMDTAVIYNQLASNLMAQKEYSEAAYLFLKVIEITKDKVGLYHPYTGSTYHNLGLIFNAQREYETADIYFYKSIEVMKVSLGKDHPYTQTIFQDLVANLRRLGKDEEARRLVAEFAANR